MSKIRAIIGGPSYLMQNDARHTGSMVDLTVALMQSGQLEDLQVNYVHSTPVEIARNDIFQSAVESDSTHLIWADSDVYWEGDSKELVWACNWLTERERPVMVVPVRQRNGVANIIINDRFERLQGKIQIGRSALECWGAGLALAIFNLERYRAYSIHSKWGSHGHPWFRTDWRPINGEVKFLSEDIWHTTRIVRYSVYNERPYWCPLVVTHHADRGHDRS